MSSLPINHSTTLLPLQSGQTARASLPVTVDSTDSSPALLAVEQSPAARVSLSTSVHPASMGAIEVSPSSPPVYEKPSVPVNYLHDRGAAYTGKSGARASQRSEERRVGKEC